MENLLVRAARKFKLRRFITHARGTCFARASFLKSVILNLLSHFFRIILRNGGGVYNCWRECVCNVCNKAHSCRFVLTGNWNSFTCGIYGKGLYCIQATQGHICKRANASPTWWNHWEVKLLYTPGFWEQQKEGKWGECCFGGLLGIRSML